jgi:hypothetical protein
MLSTQERNARIIAALKAHNPGVTNFSHDTGLPTKPVGHASGIQTSTQIVRGYRKTHRTGSQNVEPEQVIDALREAGIQRWVLMGLYGYVGYLAQPRSTQDVDVLLHADELAAATEAILQRWPKLIPEALEVVTRFRDPGEVAIDGKMKQVIDLMLPSNSCYDAILEKHFCIDETTGHRLPTIEAACAAKFSALVSPYRQYERKQQDSVDFRNIVIPNQDSIDRKRLAELGDLVYPGGSVEILEYLDLAIAQKPFPV